MHMVCSYNLPISYLCNMDLCRRFCSKAQLFMLMPWLMMMHYWNAYCLQLYIFQSHIYCNMDLCRRRLLEGTLLMLMPWLIAGTVPAYFLLHEYGSLVSVMPLFSICCACFCFLAIFAFFAFFVAHLAYLHFCIFCTCCTF